MTSYYYAGTDYSTMHPAHYDFWWHMFIPWDFLNWTWLVCLLIVLAVRFNDILVQNRLE